jgi:hypothetical protein
MPKRCVAANCSNTNKEGVSLHTFPTDETRKNYGQNRFRGLERIGQVPQQPQYKHGGYVLQKIRTGQTFGNC